MPKLRRSRSASGATRSRRRAGASSLRGPAARPRATRAGGNKFDLDRWNLEYVARLRDFLGEASRLGIVVELTFFTSHYQEMHWNEPWSDRALPAGVVNPYLAPPMRDWYPNSIEVADELSAAWQARVAAWIAGEEASLSNKHLIAQNYANFGFPVRELARPGSPS